MTPCGMVSNSVRYRSCGVASPASVSSRSVPSRASGISTTAPPGAMKLAPRRQFYHFRFCCSDRHFWVAEPVPHGDDALNMTGGVDDVAADHVGFRCAFDGDDAVCDGDGETGRVAREHAQDQLLDDRALYVRVCPAVHAQDVGAGDDADQGSVVAGDRESLEPPRVHQ